MRLRVGIIGGSGLYALDGIEDVVEEQVTTTFGSPSDAIVRGKFGDAELLFLPRHGKGHLIPPHRINYRANILALKTLGADVIISVSAVGSLKEHIAPGSMVMIDQFIDRTRSRPNSFFDEGVVCHVEFAEPIDNELRTALFEHAQKLDLPSHDGGTYMCIEGPQFSTRAESLLYRSWGADVIGMTNLPEARLAREAGLPYATVALATDYDCWHQSEESVTVDAILKTVKSNVSNAKRLLASVIPALPSGEHFAGKYSIGQSIVSDLAKLSDEYRRRLAPLIGAYL